MRVCEHSRLLLLLGFLDCQSSGIALHHLVKELASQPEAHEIAPDDESVRVAAEAERRLRVGLTDLLRGPAAQVRVPLECRRKQEAFTIEGQSGRKSYVFKLKTAHG